MSPPKTLTTHETNLILHLLLHDHRTAKTYTKCIRNYTMAALMVDTGIRVGELCSLLVTDLMFNDIPVNTLVVSGEIAKNGTERNVPLTNRVKEALITCHDAIWSHYRNSPVLYAFFACCAHKRLTTRQVERIISDAAIRTIGRPIHPHMLRHTFASKLMRVTNSRTVQTLLGHKNLTSTQIYTHPNSDDLTKAIDSLNS